MLQFCDFSSGNPGSLETTNETKELSVHLVETSGEQKKEK